MLTKTHKEILHFTAVLIQIISNNNIVNLLYAIKDPLPLVSRLEALWLLSSFHFLILKYGLAPSRLAWRRSLVKNCSMGPWLAAPPQAGGAPLPTAAPSPTLTLLPLPRGPALIISIWAERETWSERKPAKTSGVCVIPRDSDVSHGLPCLPIKHHPP